MDLEPNDMTRHQSRLGIANDFEFSFCGEQDEAAIHLLSKCEALCNIRKLHVLANVAQQVVHTTV